ncbi:unnamed protein product [Rotaria socialis]|nr:unnamed protein product [Rotaria socialis]CAF4564855.1 unnamed protein product [Rotaria socialis]CAF4886147.1 unnamed protein product [Rotaria socialis]
MEHVFHSEGISNVLSKEYPQIYQLLREEPESTAAYLRLTAEIQSIEYVSPNFQEIKPPYQSNSTRDKKKESMDVDLDESNDVIRIVQSVDKQLSRIIPSTVANDVGRSIARECLKTLPTVNAVPPGSHCLVASRINGIFDSTSDSLIWSVSYNLRLKKCEIKPVSRSYTFSSSPATKQEYMLEGTLNVLKLVGNLRQIDNLEKRAQTDYRRAKEDILREYPHVPISIEPERESITERSLIAAQPPQFSRTHKPHPLTTEEAFLKQTMANTHNCVASILTIRGLKNGISMSEKTFYHSMEQIKSYIETNLAALQKTVFVRNHIVILYTFDSASQVWSALQNTEAQAIRSNAEFTIERQDINNATFDNVIGQIRD